jgi:esterase/lipase superfamily enzyme
MVGSLGELIDGGRMKLYCVPSFDRESWTRGDLSLEDKAKRHGHYEWWVLTKLVPFVQADSHAPSMIATGASFGAYHAANFCLKRADLFPLAICMSGVYDVSVQGAGERGEAVYFNNPLDYVQHLHGDHLDWLRREASLVLVCGQGQWEDTTGALDSTRRFAALLSEKGVPCELDLWGHDVPHDWPSWRRQITHHLNRFV